MKPAVLARRRLAVLALLVLAVVAIAGCGGGGSSSGGSSSGGGGGETSSGTPEAGGTLNVAQGEENTTLLPIASYLPADINTVSNISETLWKESAEGKLEPWLVEKFKSSDQDKVWTLSLRKGVKFSNGQPMTSADVVFTLEEARKSELWGGLLGVIKSIEATNASTVVIKFSKPSPETPILMSQWSFGIVPKNFGGESEKEFEQKPIGTGPFMVGSWKHGESLTLDKNPYYWREGEPYVDQLVLKNTENANSRVTQLQSGGLDAIYAPPPAQYEAIDSGPETSLLPSPTSLAELLILNTRTPLFKNVKAREAVDYALDREGMVSAVLHGRGEPGGSIVAPAVPGYNKSLVPTTQDINKAKELLKEAVAEGVSPSFTIMQNNEDPFWLEAAQIAQQNLSEAGFKVTIKKLDASSQAELQETGEFDATTSQDWTATASIPELIAFYNAFEAQWSGAPTDETERLVNEGQVTQDPAAREKIYNELQEVIFNEKAVLTAVYTEFVWAVKDNLTGFYVNKGGVPFFGEAGFSG